MFESPKALEGKYVQTNFTSAGGYHGFCMNMRIKNLGTDTLFVLLEAGRRLNSVDDKNQDILIVKEELFVLGARMEKISKSKAIVVRLQTAVLLRDQSMMQINLPIAILCE